MKDKVISHGGTSWYELGDWGSFASPSLSVDVSTPQKLLICFLMSVRFGKNITEVKKKKKDSEKFTFIILEENADC